MSILEYKLPQFAGREQQALHLRLMEGQTRSINSETPFKTRHKSLLQSEEQKTAYLQNSFTSSAVFYPINLMPVKGIWCLWSLLLPHENCRAGKSGTGFGCMPDQINEASMHFPWPSHSLNSTRAAGWACQLLLVVEHCQVLEGFALSWELLPSSITNAALFHNLSTGGHLSISPDWIQHCNLYVPVHHSIPKTPPSPSAVMNDEWSTTLCATLKHLRQIEMRVYLTCTRPRLYPVCQARCMMEAYNTDWLCLLADSVI